MHEVLFKGKRADNGEWVYGYLIHDKYCNIQVPYIGYLTIDGVDVVEVLSETVGQYTGFTANGKKIFGGDYWIDEDNDILVVEFRNGQYCFVIYGITGEMTPNGFDETSGGFGEVDCVPMTDYYVDEIEIAGNVHDNKELLERG